MRLFVALPLPQSVAQSVLLIQGGVPGARWQTRDQLHLTLRFIGEVDQQTAVLLDEVLASIHAPAFEMQLHAVGQFGGHQIHSLWAAVRRNEALEHLQRKVDNAIRRIGQTSNQGGGDAHKFTPHVTLCRLRHPDTGKAVEWLTQHALYTSPEFTAGAFQLYSSKLTPDGSIYRIEQDYPLEGYHDEAGD
jgi:2'-5' RNA ligase